MSASEEQHAAAVIAALSTLGAAPYDYDDLSKLAVSPKFYTEVTVSRRFGGLLRGTAPTSTLVRISARAVAQTISNAREMRRRAGLLEGVVLTVGTEQSTPVQFETEDPIAPDDGWYSGMSFFTYAL